MNELQNLLISGYPLFITIDGYRQAMLAAFPLNGKIDENSNPKGAYGFTPTEIAAYLKDHTWYQFETHTALQELQKMLTQENDIPGVTLTDEFDDEELPEGSIAYHRVWGTVMANSYWYFSST